MDGFVIILFLIFFKKSRTQSSLWAISIYAFLSLSVNLIVEVAKIQNLNYILYSFFTFCEYTLFAYLLWSNISELPIKKAITYISIGFTIFLIFYYTTTKPRSIDSIPIGFETILILIYSFYWFYEQMKDTNNLFIYNKFQFWIFTGIMIYLAGSFFIYIFANQVDRKELTQYWFLTNVFAIIKSIFFAAAIFINYNKQNKQPTYQSNLHPYLN